MKLQLYNSLSKKIEDFEPLEAGKVKVYHCGPTVYKRPHIGNMRRFLFADFLHRTLEFLGYDLYEVTNITDVGHLTQDDIDAGEDKVEREARAQKTTPEDIATRVTDEYFADLKLLNIRSSNEYPRASQHIAEMQDIIKSLLEREHAYQTDSGIYFDVPSFPDYGKLSGNTVAALEAGKRVDVREDKKHPADFALWILDDEALQKWDSPWGVGYPGWHLECSAMSKKYLGEVLDIHTGGIDNKFPHHENEIAQSEGAYGKPWVRYWMHNAHLDLSGKKLAKREGEQITLDTICERGFAPLVFRLLVFGSHYRSKLDFSWEGLASAQETMATLRQLIRRLRELPFDSTSDKPSADEYDTEVIRQFKEALADDLNTPEALAVIMNYVRMVNFMLDDETISSHDRGRIWATLLKFDEVLGVIESLIQKLDMESVPSEVAKLSAEREAARDRGDFGEADKLRDQIAKYGWQVEDTDSGPRLIPT